MHTSRYHVQYYFSILPCNITFHHHVQYYEYRVQYYFSILPCNITLQYFLSSSCGILLLNTIANLFFDSIYLTYIVTL